MTRIKFCGLTRPEDIDIANLLQPEYIGFVFASASRRYISPEAAAALKRQLDSSIIAVGVFVDETPEMVAELLQRGIIDMAQLHGKENDDYIRQLRKLTDKPVIQAFRLQTPQDIEPALHSLADFILLDSGTGGTGCSFDWSLLQNITRPYFLAGGLNADNASRAVVEFHPYGLDVSSGIETEGKKDAEKMTAFIQNVRSIEK